MMIGVMLAAVMAAAAGNAPLTVDFTRTEAKVKRLNGMCNTIPLKGNLYAENTNRFAKLIRALEIPETRFHDVVDENAGIQIVDVSRIFPLFHADENDPRNYNFRPTDLYLTGARDLGGEIEFRFGEQIEHQAEQFQVQPPADIAKWARICINIARHYNDGWADGYHWNIRRFSVWEEPDNDLLLTGATKGNFEKCYFRMYAEVARGIKQLWPEAQVGGPNTMGAWNRFEQFVKYCAEEKLPLDFAAYTAYCRNTDDFFAVARNGRAVLDKYGFKQTELEVSEWHYSMPSWIIPPGEYDHYIEELTGTDAAAYHAAVLIRGQIEPVDHLFYYCLLVWHYGIFDSAHRPLPTYYVFRDFAEVVRDAVRVAGPVQPAPGWYALATRRSDGSKRLLLAAFGAEGDLRLQVKGAEFKHAQVVSPKGEDAVFQDFSCANGELTVPKPIKNSVYLFTE